MNHGVKTIIVPVRDLAAAKTLYRAILGVEPYAGEPCYAGFRVDDQEIGLDPDGRNHDMTAPAGYCHVDDAAASLSQAAGAGWRTRQDVKDVGSRARPGWLAGRVIGRHPRDQDGSPAAAPARCSRSRPDGGRGQCHGLAAPPVSFLPSQAGSSHPPVATGWQSCRFPLVRWHRTRNGAGKTTTMQLILGLDRPTAGSVTVNGSVTTRMSCSCASPTTAAELPAGWAACPPTARPAP